MEGTRRASGPSAPCDLGRARSHDRAGRGPQSALEPPRHRAAAGLGSRTSRTSSTISTRTPLRASRRLRHSGCASASSETSPPRWSGGRGPPALPAVVISSSESLGVRKPDPRFFERIVELAGCDAGEVAYVGDRVENDVIPAAAAGLVAIHVRRGPWGRLQRTPAEAAFGLDDLASLPEALASLL